MSIYVQLLNIFPIRVTVEWIGSSPGGIYFVSGRLSYRFGKLVAFSLSLLQERWRRIHGALFHSPGISRYTHVSHGTITGSNDDHWRTWSFSNSPDLQRSVKNWKKMPFRLINNFFQALDMLPASCHAGLMSTTLSSWRGLSFTS